MKLFLMIILTSIGGISLLAQQTVYSAGGNAIGVGGTASYTVGQIVYTLNTGTNGTLSQGVQQPYEISVITGIEAAIDISLEMVVYPNPTQDFVKLIINNFELQNLKYRLYDINGKVIMDNKVEGNETTISMQGCLPSIYILKVLHGNREIKLFKVIKY
jgi:hypothetical protein